MQWKEKTAEESPKPLTPWPQCYYTESEPAKRKCFLDARLSEEDSAQNRKIAELFEIRYREDRQKRYVDSFMRGWLELLMLRDMLNSAFAAKKNRKTAESAARLLCLDREEEFGRSVLFDELCHLAGLYILTCQNDSRYQSVILGFGKMREEKLREKIREELHFVAHTVPEALQMEETFSLLTLAADRMEQRML